jgi:hypothetical protein
MTKINFEQFLEATDTSCQSFVQDLHNYLLNNGCKVTFEEKKSGLLASYKHAKSKKAIVNLLFRKQGMFIRIYGENAYQYLDFLNALPEEMVQSIANATVCKRLVYNECSPKCGGYDIIIHDERHQKCRYSGFLFLITDTNRPFIKSFVENETTERNKPFVK